MAAEPDLCNGIMTRFLKHFVPLYLSANIFYSSCESNHSAQPDDQQIPYPDTGKSIADAGGSGNDIIRTSDGNYVIIGTRSYADPITPLIPKIDAYLVKITEHGDTLWKRVLGEFDAEHGNSVNEMPDGSLIIGMTTIYTQETSVHYDVTAIRTDNNGQILWKRSFLGLWAEFYGCYIQPASDGGFVISGTSTITGNGTYDVTLLKMNSSGDSLWTKTFPGAGNEYVTAFQKTSDDGYAVFGNAQSIGILGFLMKTNTSGEQLWTQSYGFLSNNGKMTGQQTADGGFILCATKLVNGYENIYLVRTNSSGDTLWTRTYGGLGADVAHRVRMTSDGGCILAGVTTSFGHPSGYDVYLVRTNSTGDTLWTRTYGGPLNDYVHSVIETDDRGFIAVGETENYGNGIFFVRTDSLGNELD